MDWGRAPTTGRGAAVGCAEEPLRNSHERQLPQASEDTSVDTGREFECDTKSHLQRQLQEPGVRVLQERNRRLQAEQQVEAEKQLCLELSRLLAFERRRVKHCRGLSTPGLIILKGKNSQNSGSGSNSISSQKSGGEDEKGEGKEEENKLDSLSPFKFIVPRQDDTGQLSAQFLFDSLSSTVFNQLPVDLQKMLHVERSEEDECVGQPPPVLSLAYRAVRMDNPRQLKEHLTVIGETVLRSPEGAELLGEACECGSDGCVRVLLDSGCCPDTTGRADGMSALHLAAQSDHASCLSLLLKWGANPSLQDKDGQTALFFALCEGYRECVDVLLEAGSSLLAITKMDYTVLHAAVSGNMADVLRRLLVYLRTTHDPNTASNIINYRDTDGNTALHLAASRGYQQCVEVLCGCQQTILTVKDRWNRMALDISTADCRDILMSKDGKEVVVCVQARLPDAQQATPIAIGRVTVLRHYKCLDVELLVTQTLEQYCHNLRGHIPMLEFDMESSYSSSDVSMPARSCRSGDNSDSLRQLSEFENENPVGEEHRLLTWVERLQRDLSCEDAAAKSDARGTRYPGVSDSFSDDLKFLRMTQQSLAKMDFSGSSIASYRVGPLSWAPGELGKQQKGKSLHAMVGDRRSGWLGGMITGGKPTEIHITLKGQNEGRLDQLAFELMIPRITLHHYISMVIRDKAVVLHGPQGCGKTYLAKNIAEFLKHKLGATKTHILYVSLHPSFKRDDLFRLLRHNGLLKLTSENIDKDGDLENQKPRIVILDHLDRISGYSTPSILSELLTMLNYRGPLNPTWLDAVHSREGNGLLYPAGMYYLKSDSYFIATRTQATGEALPVAVMDQFSHAPLAREGEPCAGVLYRQLLARLIHTRHGDTPHRWDKVYRCVCWVWELWQLYNNYMKQLDLAELSLGLKHVLQCPVESGSSDNIQSWLCQLWEHHMVPRIKDMVLHSRRMERQHHQQTAHLLLKAVVERAFRPTCPLEMEAATSLLESLYPPSSSFGPSFIPSPQQRRHPSQSSGSLQLQVTPTIASVPPVHSASAPALRHGCMVTLDNASLGSGSPNSPAGRLKGAHIVGGDSTSVDGVKLKQSSGGSALQRLRTRTVNLFRDGRVLGQGGGGEETKGKNGKARTTLPRIFKKAHTMASPPAVVENRSLVSSARDLEDFFDMLSLANSNRFDDQRSPAPKPLTQPKGLQSSSHPTSPVPGQGGPLDENEDLVTSPSSPSHVLGEESGFRLDQLPPPLTMSMPNLLCDKTGARQRSRSNACMYIGPPRGTRTHSKPAQSYGYILPPHRLHGQQRDTGATLEEPVSEPPQRRVVRREDQVVGEDLNYTSVGSSSATDHRASPLATTTHVYVRGNRARRRLSGDSSGSSDHQNEPSLNPLYSPMENMDRGCIMEDEEGGVLPVQDRDSPDGKFPSEVQVGDVSLPRRTFPDGAAVRRHQSVRATPSNQEQGYKKPYCYNSGEDGVREGWVESLSRYGSPASRGRRVSAPISSLVASGQKRPLQRVLSESDRSQSLEEIMEAARSTHILFDAGLSFLSPNSPIVKGVPTRGASFSGGSPKLGVGGKVPNSVLNEHHEM